VGELATVLVVARLVQRSAWDAGVDAVVQLHTPQPPPEPAGPAPFVAASRLTAAGWRPAGRLAAAVPRIFAHYAAAAAQARPAAARSRAG
jgi:hypothetical protein